MFKNNLKNIRIIVLSLCILSIIVIHSILLSNNVFSDDNLSTRKLNKDLNFMGIIEFSMTDWFIVTPLIFIVVFLTRKEKDVLVFLVWELIIRIFMFMLDLIRYDVVNIFTVKIAQEYLNKFMIIVNFGIIFTHVVLLLIILATSMLNRLDALVSYKLRSSLSRSIWYIFFTCFEIFLFLGGMQIFSYMFDIILGEGSYVTSGLVTIVVLIKPVIYLIWIPLIVWISRIKERQFFLGKSSQVVFGTVCNSLIIYVKSYIDISNEFHFTSYFIVTLISIISIFIVLKIASYIRTFIRIFEYSAYGEEYVPLLVSWSQEMPNSYLGRIIAKKNEKAGYTSPYFEQFIE